MVAVLDCKANYLLNYLEIVLMAMALTALVAVVAYTSAEDIYFAASDYPVEAYRHMTALVAAVAYTSA
jgi:hypothetical protein